LLKPITLARLHDRIARCVGAGPEPARPPGTPKALSPAAELAAGLRGADILLVEDTEINREMMAELLGNLGLQVRLAENGLEAVRAVQAARPDAVLMDCQMPVMDGYEATRTLRSEARFASLPIIALTANALSSDREQCLAVGMNAYLSKPVDQAELLRTLVHWIKPRRAGPPVSAAPDAETATGPIELPGIDVADGLEHVGQKRGLYLRLLRKFHEAYCVRFEADFRAALAGQDLPLAQRLAHSLKGTARTLGANQTGALAAQLEAAVKAGEADTIQTALGSVATELARVGAGLERLDEGEKPAVAG
jgi:CheY-like chemotaxis protein